MGSTKILICGLIINKNRIVNKLSYAGKHKEWIVGLPTFAGAGL